MAIRVKDINYLINRLKAKKMPFKVEQTLNTTKVITGNCVYTHIDSSSKLNNYELNLINQVKRDVINVKMDEDIKPTNYIDLEFKTNFDTKECIYEIDLNASYWNIARKNNIITEKTYNYALQNKKISKKARLISLGALAKKTYTTFYDGSQFTESNETESIYKKIFFFITRKNYEIMSTLRIIANDKYLFYWVDAIFFKGENCLNNISTYLNNQNIPFKIYKINNIIKTDDLITVDSDEHKNKLRNFNFKKDKKNIMILENDAYIIYKTEDNHEHIEKYNKLEFKKEINNLRITSSRLVAKKGLFYKITCKTRLGSYFSYIFTVYLKKDLINIEKSYKKNNEIFSLEKINI